MIDKNFLNQLAIKSQTTFRNVLREYYQNLFLSYFYQTKQSDLFFFKGGTALRIVFKSPRFSEDLDFTASGDFPTFEQILEEVLIAIQQEGIETKIIESKTTTNGFFAILEAPIHGETIEVQLQASQREKKKISGEKAIIVTDIIPAYVLQTLEKQELFSEKIEALLSRQRIRDFFDLYFILRSGIKIPIIDEKRQEVMQIVESHQGGFTELKEFLPRSFLSIVKDLKQILISELQKQKF